MRRRKRRRKRSSGSTRIYTTQRTRGSRDKATHKIESNVKAEGREGGKEGRRKGVGEVGWNPLMTFCAISLLIIEQGREEGGEGRGGGKHGKAAAGRERSGK